MTQDYCSLHNHTTFSIMHSLLSPKDLFNRAKELGQSAIGVTDLGTLAGAWDCLKYSRETGVKLIMGGEFYFLDDLTSSEENHRLRHVILLAKNAQGYQNLLQLSFKAFEQKILAFKKVIPRIDWKLLEAYSEGLICLTACSGGIVAQLLNTRKMEEAKQTALRLKNIFQDNLGLEIQPHTTRRIANLYKDYEDQKFTNHQMIKLGKELNIRVVATVNAHYLTPEQHETHDAMLAIGSGQPVFSGNRIKYDAPNIVKNEETGEVKVTGGLHMKSRQEVKDFFANYLEADVYCDNSLYFASLCETPDWIDPKYSNPSGKELPEFPVKDQADFVEFKTWKDQTESVKNLADDVAYLRFWCEKTFTSLVPTGQEEKYRARIAEELEVIEHLGFSSYLLIVADVLDFCRKNDILVGVGRGSVGGSVVAYLLGIHMADPFEYDLIFARFLNRYKPEYPDIDNDIASSGRDQVLEYIYQKYGYDHVAHVSNIIESKPKVYVRDIARAFQFGGDAKAAVAIGNALAESIPKDITTMESALKDAPLFMEYANSDKYKQLKQFAADLGAKPKTWGTHAAGIVIGKRPILDFVPLRIDKNDQISLEYEKVRAEANGLVKIDFLGVKTLDILSETYRIIKAVGKPTPPNPPNFKEYDQKTYDLISNGDTLCVFQLGTSAGTVDLCKKIKPKSIQDIAIINALARPSARDIRQLFVEVRDGIKQVKLLHPLLERAFGRTYGFGLFEESLMYLALDLAKWDLHKADGLRKLTKDKGKYPEKVAKLKSEFITDCVANNVEESIAKRIWEEVVDKFQGYGFNACLYFSELIDVYTDEGEFIETKMIKDIRPNEYVKSRNEESGRDIFVRVKRVYENGIKELVEVNFYSGAKVKCTLDHKFRTEAGAMLSLREIIEKNINIINSNNIDAVHYVKIISSGETYDLEVDHKDHQFYLSNGILTSNSHATFYSMLGYHTAYLKAHFPLEFLTANLKAEVNSNALDSKDQIMRIKSEIRRHRVNILPPEINTSDTSYSIVNEHTLRTGLDALKFMGKDAIPEILIKRPFDNFEDFLSKVDGRKVRSLAVQALAASGSLDKFNMSRKQMFLYASDYKKKLSVWLKRVNKSNTFDYPWPDKVGEWTIPEKFAMERKYLGEGLCGNKFQVYPNFFNSSAPRFNKFAEQFPDPQDTDVHFTIPPFQAEILDFFEFKVKKETSASFGKEMAKVLLEDPWGSQLTMTIFSKQWKTFRDRIKALTRGKSELIPGIGIIAKGVLNWYGGELSIIFEDILACAPPPPLPNDLEHKKVSMKLGRGKKKEVIEEITTEEVMTEVEDDLIEEGFADLEEDNFAEFEPDFSFEGIPDVFNK